jgi:hypothetical protein
MPKPETLAELLANLTAFTYSIQKPGTIWFNHTVLEDYEFRANKKVSELYPGAVYVLVSSSKRVTL